MFTHPYLAWFRRFPMLVADIPTIDLQIQCSILQSPHLNRSSALPTTFCEATMAAQLLRAARSRGAAVLLTSSATRSLPAASLATTARCFASESAAPAAEAAKKGGSVRLLRLLNVDCFKRGKMTYQVDDISHFCMPRLQCRTATVCLSAVLCSNHLKRLAMQICRNCILPYTGCVSTLSSWDRLLGFAN